MITSKQTDILYAVDDGDLYVLALLDLSAAFDTVTGGTAAISVRKLMAHRVFAEFNYGVLDQR